MLHIILAISLLAWPLMLFGSLFLFDAPNSMESPLTQFLAATFWLYPVPLIIGFVGFVSTLKQKNTVKSLVFTGIALLSPVSILLAFILLEAICNGKFACS